MLPASGRTPSRIGLRVTFDARTPILHVTGEIDLSTADLLRDALSAMAETERQVIVDLADVSFIDLRGLENGIVEVARAGEPGGVTVSIRNPPRTLRRILDVTNLDEEVDAPPG